MTDAIRPDEVKVKLTARVLKAVNTLISNNWDGTQAEVSFTEIMLKSDYMLREDLEKEILISKNPIAARFAEEGWVVESNIHDSYDPYWIFRKA